MLFQNSKIHVMKLGYIHSRQESFAAMLSFGLASQDSPQEGEEAHLVLASSQFSTFSTMS